MRLWITSDTHFGHQLNIRKPGFEEVILKFISERVGEDDILLNLGDFCWHSHEYWTKKYMEASKCKKWLVLGNHDKKSVQWHMGHGFDFVADAIVIKRFGEDILLTHKPQEWFGQYDINVHGHLHNNSIDTIRVKDKESFDVLNNKQVLVQLEDNGYQCFTLDWLVKKYRRTRG